MKREMIIKELKKIAGVAPLATPWGEVLISIAEILGYKCEEDNHGVMTPWGWTSWENFFKDIILTAEKIYGIDWRSL